MGWSRRRRSRTLPGRSFPGRDHRAPRERFCSRTSSATSSPRVAASRKSSARLSARSSCMRAGPLSGSGMNAFPSSERPRGPVGSNLNDRVPAPLRPRARAIGPLLRFIVSIARRCAGRNGVPDIVESDEVEVRTDPRPVHERGGRRHRAWAGAAGRGGGTGPVSRRVRGAAARPASSAAVPRHAVRRGVADQGGRDQPPGDAGGRRRAPLPRRPAGVAPARVRGRRSTPRRGHRASAPVSRVGAPRPPPLLAPGDRCTVGAVGTDDARRPRAARIRPRHPRRLLRFSASSCWAGCSNA